MEINNEMLERYKNLHAKLNRTVTTLVSPDVKLFEF